MKLDPYIKRNMKVGRQGLDRVAVQVLQHRRRPVRIGKYMGTTALYK